MLTIIPDKPSFVRGQNFTAAVVFDAKKPVACRKFTANLVCVEKTNLKEMQLNTYFQEAHAFFLTCDFQDVSSIPNWKYGLTCYFMRKML